MRRTRRAALAVAVSTAALVGSTVAPASAASFLDPGAVCAVEAPPAPVADRDLVPEVHRAAVDCAFARDIVNGRPQGGALVYDPTGPVRRDQMATFLVQMLIAGGYDVPAPSGQPFGDIAGNVHADRIRQLAQMGITAGSSPGAYAPERVVTRGMMATYLLNTFEFAFGEADLADDATGAATFPDVPAGYVHQASVQALSELFEVATGYPDGTYRPETPTTRAQMATFVARVLDLTEVPQP